MSTNEGMQTLISIVNKLQDAFAHLGQRNPLDLPQIVKEDLGCALMLTTVCVGCGWWSERRKELRT